MKFLGSSAFRYGCTNVTTLANIPMKTRLVYASISADESFSIDTTSYTEAFNEFPDGIQIKTIVYNSSGNSITITLPSYSHSYRCFDDYLIVSPLEYVIIDTDIKSSDEIYVEARTVEPAGFTGKEAVVALSNGTDYKFIKNSKLADFKSANSDYEPIGVVVIPSCCTNIIFNKNSDIRYGSNIIMSLKTMSLSTPDTGGLSNSTMMWGGYDVDTSITKYNVMNITNNIDDTISTRASGQMASDLYTNTVSRVYPRISYNSTSYMIPSPFKSVDGELIPNEQYYSVSSSTKNVLAQFQGPRHTYLLTKLATSQSDWKTKDVEIISNSGGGYYAPACCCARYGGPDNSYAPKGTSSFLKYREETPSDTFTNGVINVWYMPSLGEFGFAVPHLNVINEAFNNINSLYGNSTCNGIQTSDGIWTTSEYSDVAAYGYNVANGDVVASSKTVALRVRAFCAIRA